MWCGEVSFASPLFALHSLKAEQSPANPGPQGVLRLDTSIGEQTISLKALPVSVSGPLGSATTYALLDNGLNSILIGKDLVKRLRLIDQLAVFSFSTMVQTEEVSYEVVELQLSALDGQENFKENSLVRPLPSSSEMIVPAANIVGCWRHQHKFQHSLL
ncbi:hypothetical protein FGIG_08959 [Fasciola gigantica]|uniref:Uncharacterized protein n=1 Tax=Fasciola gigantica TaxID=46835 RepID=A0A504YZY1_FASGI|nr:hypothetical protein FGIG_08959 [Fasciola gigantica]